jgi:hypothetical protein
MYLPGRICLIRFGTMIDDVADIVHTYQEIVHTYQQFYIFLLRCGIYIHIQLSSSLLDCVLITHTHTIIVHPSQRNLTPCVCIHVSISRPHFGLLNFPIKSFIIVQFMADQISGTCVRLRVTWSGLILHTCIHQLITARGLPRPLCDTASDKGLHVHTYVK